MFDMRPLYKGLKSKVQGSGHRLAKITCSHVGLAVPCANCGLVLLPAVAQPGAAPCLLWHSQVQHRACCGLARCRAVLAFAQPGAALCLPWHSQVQYRAHCVTVPRRACCAGAVVLP